jgi:HD domain
MARIKRTLPDSELCNAAVAYARTVSDPFLFHHVMRSAIFADLIGRRSGMKFDREVLCVSTVLHDLGLTTIAPVQMRFEIEGADLAKDFLSRKGMSERRLEIVWDAIALHSTAEIPSKKCSEVALCQLGIAADIGIAPPDVVSDETVDGVLAAYPWLDMHESLPTALVGLFRKNPKAASSNAVSEACERRVSGFKRFNLCDRLVDTHARRNGGLSR